MPATIIPFTPTAGLFAPPKQRDSTLTTRRTKRTRVKCVDEPETRLWKACARQRSRGEIIIELIIFAVFVFISLAPVACFVEVQQRLDAIDQAARGAKPLRDESERSLISPSSSHNTERSQRPQS
jgi:hypothetical protein